MAFRKLFYLLVPSLFLTQAIAGQVSSACKSDQLTENLKLLKEQQKFAQKQIFFSQNELKEIVSNYSVASKGDGLQQAFLNISKYAFTTALLLEGFGVKTAGGLIRNNGVVVGRIISTPASKWQAFRKIMLITEESIVYPLAPTVFSGYSSPKAIGEGFAQAMVNSSPQINEYDIESLPLTGFTNDAQWEDFQDTLKDDLRTFYRIHQDIYNQRAQFDNMLKGITFKYSMSRQKEVFQKLFDEYSAHLQIYKFQKNYLALVEKKLIGLCTNQTVLNVPLPKRTPVVLKDIEIFTLEDYLKNVARFPAPVKKALNRFESWSLSKAKEDAKRYGDASWLPEKIKVFLMIMSDLMTPLKDPIRQARLDRTVNRLRPFVYDDGMRSCYNAQLMGSDIKNAINVGCDIFVTSSLMDKLTDDQLAAVIAHELSHGEQGHLVVNVQHEGTSLKKHVMNYFSDMIDETVSNVSKDYIESVRRTGHLDNFMTVYSELAPKIEIQADQGGVLILERAGISRKHLIDALVILHDKDPSQVDIKRPETFGPSDMTNGVRNYPGLLTRIRSIQAVVSPASKKR
ncbi:MAG: M48 family metalloprotease [Bacteriovoracaceae bacterium]